MPNIIFFSGLIALRKLYNKVMWCKFGETYFLGYCGGYLFLCRKSAKVRVNPKENAISPVSKQIVLGSGSS